MSNHIGTDLDLIKSKTKQNMPVINNENSFFSSGHGEKNEELSLQKILSSKKWTEYFQELSKTLGLEISGYDEDGDQLFIANESPYCKFLRSAGALECPDSCSRFMDLKEVRIFKCRAGLSGFVFPVQQHNEKVFIVGRAGFAEYEDLLDFLKTARQHNLSALPVSMPLDFPGRNYIEAASKYVHLTVNRQLTSFEEQYRLEEKLIRMTLLFDNRAFGALARNPELMYRYILDTIDFVFGQTSAAILVLEERDSVYKTTYSTGKHRDAIAALQIKSDNPVIDEMRNKRASIFYRDLDNVINIPQFKSAHFFPIFTGGTVKAIICIFDKEFSSEDMRILNAFMDCVQLNLENQSLRITVSKNKKADERLSYLMDLSNSIISILDKERLLNTLLDKSLQLLRAEQGSLMLLDSETSELVVEAKRSIDDLVQEKMRLKKEDSISGKVLDSGAPLLVQDIEKDPRIRQVNRPRYRTRSFISVPIRIEDRLAGVLNVADKIQGEAFNEDDLKLIESLINNVAIAIERSLLYKQTESLQKLSITDPLTGIYNRRYLNRRLSEEITRYNRYKHPFSFMMLDLDKFKAYNDTFGHISGDNLIRTLANIMEKSLRTIDIAARFGGDEFVAIFPQTPKVDAIQISNRLKEKIDNALREHNVEMPLTVSVGLATFPDDASSIMELIEKTDQALYLAKKGGGNRVVYL